MASKIGFHMIAVFVVFAATLPKNSVGTLQSITFFRDSGCPATAENQTFTETNDQLEGTWVENANSVFIVGLWKISNVKSAHYNTQPPQGRCVNRTEWSTNPKIIWIERLGPSDMSTSQITFFTEIFYTGLSYTITSDSLEQLPLPDNPRPLSMRSYIQFGKDSWTTYPEINFVGEASHFEASKTAEDPSDSFTYNESMLVIVGSVKRDLKDDNDDGKSSASKASIELIALIFIGILSVFTTNMLKN